MKFSRCLPHCASLVVKAFLEPLDTEYKISSHLKKLRGLMTAGGGSAKKLLALEYGITCSSIDFTDTRWASLVRSIVYLAKPQSKKDLLNARERLQELVDAGNDDGTAKAALDGHDKPSVVYNVCYQYVEAIAEAQLQKLAKECQDSDDPLGDKHLVQNRKDLLAFFSDPTNFAAVQLIEILLGGNVEHGVESVSSIMIISQGRADYDNKLDSRITGEVPHAAAASRALINLFGSLYTNSTDPDDLANIESAKASIRKEVEARLKIQTETLISVSRDSEERMYPRQEAGVWHDDQFTLDDEGVCADFEKKDVPKFRLAQTALYPAVLDDVMSTLDAALEAVAEAAGLEKLEECVASLEVSQHFNINIKPPTLALDSDILEHLGSPENLSFAVRAQLLAAWKAYVGAWKAPKLPPPPPNPPKGYKAPKALPPREVFAYWKDFAETDDPGRKLLGTLAMQSFSRPISSACCERIFSYLEKMDDSDRRNMKKETLRRLLFLRGNWRVLNQIVEEEHAARVTAELAGRKRRQQVRADTAQAQFDAKRALPPPAAAAAAAGGGMGGGGKSAVALAVVEDEMWEEYEEERWR